MMGTREWGDALRDRADTVFEIRCDSCESVTNMTVGDAQRAGWRRYWRTVRHGYQVQRDACPACCAAKKTHAQQG